MLVGQWGWKAQTLRRTLRKRNIRPWVHHLEGVTDRELPGIYRSAFMTLFPSHYEGFGLPIVESMKSGTPVIASSTSSIPEVAGDAALLVDPYNIQDMCDAIHGLIQSSTLRKTLSEKGKQRAQIFTWDQTARQTLEVLEQSATRF